MHDKILRQFTAELMTPWAQSPSWVVLMVLAEMVISCKEERNRLVMTCIQTCLPLVAFMFIKLLLTSQVQARWSDISDSFHDDWKSVG